MITDGYKRKCSKLLSMDLCLNAHYRLVLISSNSHGYVPKESKAVGNPSILPDGLPGIIRKVHKNDAIALEWKVRIMVWRPGQKFVGTSATNKPLSESIA
jgi:hypothetical protein